jgi:hypothetical protein
MDTLLPVLALLVSSALVFGVVKAADADAFARKGCPPFLRDAMGLVSVLLVVSSFGYLIHGISGMLAR